MILTIGGRLKLIFALFFVNLMSANLMAGELLDLYKKALDINPTLLSRGYSIDQIAAREDQAFSALLPQVSLTGNYSYNRYHPESETTSYYDSLRGTAQANQVLFDLPAYLRYKSAEEATLQSELERDAYLMSLGGDLVDRYLLVLESVDTIVNLKEEKISVQSQIQRLKKMRERQMVTVTDLYEVEAYGHDLNTQIIEAENEKAIALERIRELTSVIPGSLPSLNITKMPEVPVNVEQWIEDATNNNPSISALKAGLEAAEKTIYGSQAGHLPTVSVQLSQTYSDQGFDNRQSSAYNVGTASLQLNIPVFSGGRISAEVREAVASRHIVFQELERAKRELERETRTSFLNAVVGQARIDSTQRQLDARKKATKALQKGYELGVSTIIDVLESRRDLMQTQTEVWQARYQYLRSLVLLKVWTGNLTMPYMEKVDQWFPAK